VCGFFDSPEDEYAVTLPFVKDGLQRGEKSFHIVDPALREEYTRRLGQAGISVGPTQETGQLEIRPWTEAYLRRGHFDQNDMLQLIQDVLGGARTAGYPLTRLIAHMEWSREDRPGVDDIVEYETRLNYVLPKYPDPVLWLYETPKYGGDVVMDILLTHPLVVVGGTVRTNPFFVPPDEFLEEIRARRSRSVSRAE
jgi:hypothetical protein